jgi:deoxycytidylate deaminase
VVTKASESPSAASFRSALSAMIERAPERHPLIVGLVAPLGTRTERVARAIEDAAAHFDYNFESIRLSDLLDEIDNGPWEALPKRGQRGYYDRRQDAGDKLREDAGHSALAALAISKLAPKRKQCKHDTIYLLNSLKHPDEVKLLQHVYGDSFWLLAIVVDPDARGDDLAEQLARIEAMSEDPHAEAEGLMRRDEDDDRKAFGQHVRDVFEQADAYVPMDRGQDLDSAVVNIFEGIFQKPFHTPSLEEVAMCMAYQVSLRSAAMGRQVGAVLRPVTGGTYVVGTNEVPKPGGGQYWSGDEPDFRDFSLDDDPNPIFVSRMLQELFVRLAERGWLEESKTRRTGDELLRLANEKAADGKSLLGGTRAASVIEFTRCLHAEQAVIVNAARQGVTTQAATLYTTTFPCHECAKFIVGAGVVEVVYIEPYPKSLVWHLYRDLIDVRATRSDVRDETGLVGGKVAFRPYVGFAPKRYNLIFTAPQRREGTEPKRFVPRQAQPRGEAWSENAIIEKEASAAKAITGLLIELYNPGARLDATESDEGKNKGPSTHQSA